MEEAINMGTKLADLGTLHNLESRTKALLEKNIDQNNIEKTIEYLNLGRDMFEDDQSLINTEINLYIQLGRTTELIAKLSEAIELDPENNLLYFKKLILITILFIIL